MANYYFYTALDDLAVVRGYDYPAGRITWCFWLSIIGSIVSALLNIAEQGTLVIVIGLLVQAAILVLLWQYLQAVRKDEPDA